MIYYEMFIYFEAKPTGLVNENMLVHVGFNAQMGFFFFPDEDDEADEDGVKINSLYTQKQMHGKQSIKN